MKTTLLAIAVLVLAWSPARVAEACSAPPCWPGYFVPGDAAHVPANLAAVYWRPMSSVSGPRAADPSRVVLATAADPGTPLRFTAKALANGDFELLLDAPLVAGTSYTLSDGNTCELTGAHGPHVAFTAGPAAPLPSQLGALVVTDGDIAPLDVATSAGSCSIKVSADRSTFVLAPTADAQPWLDVLQFETFVDGEIWRAASSINATTPPGVSWHGRGGDLVYRVCGTEDDAISPGVATGTHEVRLRAILAGTSTVIASDTTTIAVACANEPQPPCTGPACAPDDSGCSAGGSGGTGGARGPNIASGALLLALGLLLRRRRLT